MTLAEPGALEGQEPLQVFQESEDLLRGEYQIYATY